MKDLLKNKMFLAVGISIIILVIIIVIFYVRKNKINDLELQEQLTNAEIIPTVDSNVNVSLKEADKRGELLLTVRDAPSGTTAIEYQLTYGAISREEGGSVVSRGVIGKCIQQLSSQSTWSCQQPNSEEAIILGTCSSGTCVYDNITGDINVQLKFTGSYGERIFEKDFKI
ncbi:MAG: hypothetical protein Q8P65_01410 [bacterium]|nr:hypothetical protein [bacterium]